MAGNSTVKMTVIWSDEVREAAKLLRAWHDATSDEERVALMAPAFNACLVALWGITDDTPLIMLGSRDIKRVANDSGPQLELDTGSAGASHE